MPKYGVHDIYRFFCRIGDTGRGFSIILNIICRDEKLFSKMPKYGVHDTFIVFFVELVIPVEFYSSFSRLMAQINKFYSSIFIHKVITIVEAKGPFLPVLFLVLGVIARQYL